MQTLTTFYIAFAFILSVLVAYFQYFFKVKNKPKLHYWLAYLKAISLFLLGLLLINPKTKNTKTENIKPVLSVLVDNSLSTKHFEQEKRVTNFIELVKKHNKLNKKFDINFFSFGKAIDVLDSLTFNETQTNISKAIQSVNSLYKNNLGATILLSDGNQTFGNDYEFMNSEKAVFPVVLGDTTHYQDLRISQLNVNKYSYIKNKFPVEVLLFYDGNKDVSSVFTISKGGRKVFSKKVSFSKNNNTQTITANLTSNKEGIQYYSAGIGRIKNEKNTKNNYKNFSVEVINEQTKVLILSSILHPDLGALKKSIESNKQRKVDIRLTNKFKSKDVSDYQLVIFYQPNGSFKNAFQNRKSNYIVISGTKTDWNFINSLKIGFSKQAIYQSENYGAVYNPKFLTFMQKDIRFHNFPPLKDRFGEVKVGQQAQTLLYQKMVGVVTKNPLLATFEQEEKKMAVIFGEGIWKWRSASFREEQSFELFDEFVSNLVQFVVSNKKRKRLEVDVKRIYPANSSIVISAQYLDKNYRFDNRAILQLSITNTNTKEKKIVPFTLVNNSYQVNVEGLKAGDYSYKVSVGGQNMNSYGKFKVENYQVEEQFTSANTQKLQKLADKTGGTLCFKHKEQQLFEQLIADKKYYTTQKSTIKQENLINWKWMLFFIVVLLSLEWFLRKYFGKI